MAFPLEDLVVVDCSSIIAGPMIGTLMGDFGAEVITVEDPGAGDPLRHHGEYEEDLMWKTLGRNKRSVAVDLREPEGRDAVRQLVDGADVFVENFRPGRAEEWNLGWETLSERNPGLVMVRMTGFGQTGPYKDKPGFGTLAEAMSGFAYRTGTPDRPPQLPPLGTADTIAGIHATVATMFALYYRDVGDGTGQYIDASILELMFAATSAFQVPEYSEKGIVRERMGNRSPHSAPRNTYRTKDDRWVAISTSAETIAKRVLRIVGGDELVEDPRFETMAKRVEHADELDAIVGDWIAERERHEVIRIFDEHDAAVAPVYNIADIFEDPHFRARDALVDVPDEELDEVTLHGVVPKFSATPGEVRHAGPAIGAHTASVLGERTDLDERAVADLADRGIVRLGSAD